MGRNTRDVVMVLTSKSFETMVEEGGSGNWKANENSVRRCRWIIAVRNRHSNWSQGDEDHGTAFLIGRVVGVKKSPKYDDRLVIVFDRYAQLSKSNAWPTGNRNPVCYTSLNALGIDVDHLKWKDFPARTVVEAPNTQTEDGDQTPGTVFERAKMMIAQSLAISPASVSISIQI